MQIPSPLYVVSLARKSNLELAHVWLRFQVLAATIMKMVIFWDVAPCSLLTDVS
jgi:hypothetical protein